MEVTSALIYSIRFGPKLPLPPIIQDNIARLRIVPAAYRPIRPIKQRFLPRKRPDETGNWRENILVEYVRKVRETNDPNYDAIFEIFNKVAPANIEKLSAEAILLLSSNDKQFRLRTTTLLFDKAIRGSYYAGVMADIAEKLNVVIPEISEDLETHVSMFGTLYDMNETLVFPQMGDPAFEDKVVAWSKQKDIRRGYARFLTHLYIRKLVSGEALQNAMDRVIVDLSETITNAKSAQSEENVTQYCDFIFEISKLLPSTGVELRGLIFTKMSEILARPRLDLPSLNMRSRFKLEDAVKCVQVS